MRQDNVEARAEYHLHELPNAIQQLCPTLNVHVSASGIDPEEWKEIIAAHDGFLWKLRRAADPHHLN